jgi:hypothetical protein
MLRRTFALIAAIASAVSLTPALAQDTPPAIAPAEAGTWQALAGEAILYYVGGRTLADTGGDPFNPYEIDGEGLLYTLGSFFVTTTYEGGAVHEGEVSIYPQFNTPLAAFEPSTATPGIIPFALMKGGVCFGGYVSGYPVPETTYAVDMTDQICHAAIVEEIVYAQYLATNPVETEPQPDPEPEDEPVAPTGTFDPANPLDIDLDVAVWAAYNAAYALAIADPDYFFIRDGNFDTIRDAITAQLVNENLPGIAVIHAATEAEAYGCAPAGTTQIRIAFTAGDAGITLVAASSRSVSTYVYNPDVSADLDIDYARGCTTEGFGRARSLNVP